MRIGFHCSSSPGQLYPMLSLARELQSRGHRTPSRQSLGSRVYWDCYAAFAHGSDLFSEEVGFLCDFCKASPNSLYGGKLLDLRSQNWEERRPKSTGELTQDQGYLSLLKPFL